MPLSITKLHQALGEPTDPIWDGSSDASIISILKKIDQNLNQEKLITPKLPDQVPSGDGAFVDFEFQPEGLYALQIIGEDGKKIDFMHWSDTPELYIPKGTFFGGPIIVGKLVEDTQNKTLLVILRYLNTPYVPVNGYDFHYNWGFAGSNLFWKPDLGDPSKVKLPAKVGFSSNAGSWWVSTNADPEIRYNGGLGTSVIPVPLRTDFEVLFNYKYKIWISGESVIRYPQWYPVL